MKKFICTAIALFISLFVAFTASASSVISLPNPLTSKTFEELINTLINWLVVISLPIVTLLIVYAGVVFLVSGVSPDQQRQAKNIIIYALVGLAIIILAKALAAVVTGVFA